MTKLLLKKIIKKNNQIKKILYKLNFKFQNYIQDGIVVLPIKFNIDSPVSIFCKGEIKIHENVCFGHNLSPKTGNGLIQLQTRKIDAKIEIGEKSKLSNNISIISNNSIKIGKNVLLGDNVSIFDSDFHSKNYLDRSKPKNKIESKEIVIEDNVLIGSKVIILKGTVIEENSIIGAGSVVCGYIPKDVIAVGVPAKVIKSISKNE
tara:strand:- start:2226 stop:2840 length:615 start_codon:yes stop_codon:yes gene_type:complete